jgi:acyl-ACP thioesterase
MLKHEKRITVHGHLTDFHGRLGVKTLCALFNDVANEQTLVLGVDVETFHRQGITWMLHRLGLRVSRLPSQGEEVIIETWPSGADRLFAFRDFAVVTPSGELLARATSEWMVIDLERRRPVRLPATVLAMAPYYEGVTREMVFQLPLVEMPAEVSGRRRFVASYDTIDFNRHVTQASYVGWVTNALPFDFLSRHVLRELEVLYEREVLPDSEVDSLYLVEEHAAGLRVTHRVEAPVGGATHCLARSVWSSREAVVKS